MTSEVKWPLARPGLQNFWHARKFPRHSAFTGIPIFFYSFAREASLCCEEYVYIYISDIIQAVYALPLLPNITASAKMLHKSEEVRSVKWIFIIGVPVWRRLCKYMT